MTAFPNYVAGKPPTGDDPFIMRIDELVTEAKQKTEWKVEYMTLAMRDALNFEDGAEYGRQEGRQEALLDIARRMLSAGMSPEQISRLTVLPMAEVRALMGT